MLPIKIKIKIKNLGAIRNSELEVTPIMIFSGESGLGKSYLSILVHYLFEVLLSQDRLSQFFLERGFEYNHLLSSFRGQGEAIRFTKNSLEEWLSQDAISYLRDMLGHDQLDGDIEIHLPDSIPNEIIINYREDLLGVGGNEGVYILFSSEPLNYRVPSEPVSVDEESPFSALLRYVLRAYIFGKYENLTESIVLPPARAVALTEYVAPRTGMYKRFGFWLLRANTPIGGKGSKTSAKLQEFISQLLGGNVERTEDGNYVYRIDQAEIPLSAAAASVRELAPLQLLFRSSNVGTASVLFEEPEAHLHAEKQRLVADVISLINNEGGYMQITTHSDYFLGRINELIKLQRLYELLELNKRIGEFESICTELEILPELRFQYKDRLSSYYLMREEDGSTKVVRDEDVENGITFKSFRKAVHERIDIVEKLDDRSASLSQEEQKEDESL